MKEISVESEEISEKLMDFPENSQDPPFFLYSPADYQIKYVFSHKISKPLLFVSANFNQTSKPSILQKNENPYHARIFREIRDKSLHFSESPRVLLEFLEESVNLSRFLEENEGKPHDFLKTLNIMYQLCDFFRDFPQKPEQNLRNIFPYHFYLQGNVLRTDIFLGLFRDKRKKNPVLDDFLSKFQPFSRKPTEFSAEIKVFFFIGVVFHRLFTGDFPMIQSQAPYFQRKSLDIYTKDAEIKLLLKKMLNVMDMNKSITKINTFSKNLQEFREVFRRFFKEKCGFSASFEKNSLENNENLRKLTIKIQEFLITLQENCENCEIFAGISLIIGFFAVFLRNLLSFPVFYQENAMTAEMIRWILALQEENRVFFKKYREYLEKAREISNKSKFFTELLEEIPDFSAASPAEALKFLEKYREFLEKHVERELFCDIFAVFSAKP